MKIRIVGKQMDVSDELKELVAKKLKNLIGSSMTVLKLS